MRFAPDDRIGNYRVERELGATNTGALYQVVHVVLPRRAVLKVTSLPPFAKQVLREACILEALLHPGIPQVFESGLLPDKRPWFAAEAIAGFTLVEHVVRGPMEAFDVAILARDVAEVLEHAHRRGVVHRGLRPDRIVMTPRRRFGVCIPDWSDARTHDAAHTIPHVPSPASRYYVAPELARGDSVDDRADIFALGVIAFLALTGRHPTSSPMQPERASTLEACPAAPPELARMIDQMMATDRYDRPSSAELRADLDRLVTVLSQEEIVPVEVVELPRIRKPKWTPALPIAAAEAVVAGEIANAIPKRR